MCEKENKEPLKKQRTSSPFRSQAAPPYFTYYLSKTDPDGQCQGICQRFYMLKAAQNRGFDEFF